MRKTGFLLLYLLVFLAREVMKLLVLILTRYGRVRLVFIERKNRHFTFQSPMTKIALKAKSRTKTKYQNSAPMKRSVSQLI